MNADFLIRTKTIVLYSGAYKYHHGSLNIDKVYNMSFQSAQVKLLLKTDPFADISAGTINFNARISV